MERRWLAAALLPYVVLLPLAAALALLFDQPERDGLVALGLAPTEVAVVALVAVTARAGVVAAAVVSFAATAAVKQVLYVMERSEASGSIRHYST